MRKIKNQGIDVEKSKIQRTMASSRSTKSVTVAAGDAAKSQNQASPLVTGRTARAAIRACRDGGSPEKVSLSLSSEDLITTLYKKKSKYQRTEAVGIFGIDDNDASPRNAGSLPSTGDDTAAGVDAEAPKSQHINVAYSKNQETMIEPPQIQPQSKSVAAAAEDTAKS